MKIKFYPFLLITILLTIFFIFFKGLQNSSVYKPKIEIGKSIPVFQTKLFDTEKIISSKEIFDEDNFYLLNIWASWCVPCIEEHPFLVSLNDYKDLKIIGLNYKDNINGAKDFLKKLDNPYNLILSDENGTIAVEWGAYGVPESFLIHKNKIVKKIIGPLNASLLSDIKKLIK
tara:strand:- start:361 stop:879 length:519 start_codon:yes stop_codon:yes gene_type:complete